MVYSSAPRSITACGAFGQGRVGRSASDAMSSPAATSTARASVARVPPQKRPRRARAPGREPLGLASRDGAGIEAGADWAAGGALDRFLQRRGQERPAWWRPDVAGPEDHCRAGLAGRRQPFEHEARGTRTGGFGDEDELVGTGVRRKEADGVERGEATHRIGEIASAHPDAVGDARACTREQHRDLLQPRPRCGDHPDPASGNDVRECERRSGDVGGTAVRPHHQQSEFVSALLERPLRLGRDVVAEHHHVQPAIERAPRLAGRMDPGSGNQREVRVPHALQRTVEGAGSPPCFLRLHAAAFKGGCGMRDCAFGKGSLRGTHRHDQIVRSGCLTGRRQESGFPHDFQIRWRPAHRHRVLDALQGGEIRRKTHQRHGVQVKAPPHVVDDHPAHGPSIPSTSPSSTCSKHASGAFTIPAPT